MMPGSPSFPEPKADRPAVRIGILTSDNTNFEFFNPVINAIQKSCFANLTLAIHTQSHAPCTKNAFKKQGLLTRLHRLWDVRRNREKLRRWRDDVNSALEQIPLMTLNAETPLSTSAQREIRAHGLDVIIACGGSDIDPLSLYATSGVWSLRRRSQDDVAKGSYFPATPRKRNPTSRIDLIAQRDAEECARTLGHSVAKNLQSLSLIEVAEVEGQAAAELVCWKLWQLHTFGRPAETADESQLASPPARISRSGVFGPAFGLSFLGNYLLQRISNTVKPAARREWQIGLRSTNGTLPWEGPIDDFKWIDAPSGHYLADPILFEHQGRTWLFAEDYDHAAGKGHLVCAPLDPDGKVGLWQTVLDLPYHLSFPHVFDHRGDIYLIPESSAGGSVDLYRATKFPCRWEKLRTLWEGPALDTVPYFGEGDCWYFFTSIQTSKLLPPQLLLFTAKDLQSPWRLHPASPLSLDVRYARNAGRILPLTNDDGNRRLIRLSQDGSGKYGSKLHFHEIEVLTPQRYVERLIGTRLPPRNRDGIHQYDRSTQLEVFDVSGKL